MCKCDDHTKNANVLFPRFQTFRFCVGVLFFLVFFVFLLSPLLCSSVTDLCSFLNNEIKRNFCGRDNSKAEYQGRAVEYYCYCPSLLEDPTTTTELSFK